MLPCGFLGGGNDNENTIESVCGGDDSDDGGVAAAQQTAPAASAPQAAAPADAQSMAKMAAVPNPVTGTVKAQLARFSKNMVGAAELMPAEKYGFKPSPEMNSFGHVVMHIAQSNNGLWLEDFRRHSTRTEITDSDPKDKLVAALKAFLRLLRRRSWRRWTIPSWAIK